MGYIAINHNDKTAAFMARLISMYNHAGLCSLISIGDKLGLFDVVASHSPAKSTIIASAANINERYLREWLAAMVTGGIIEYDSSNQTYSLPTEHAACLTHAAYPNNLALLARFFPIFSKIEDEIIECFKTGKGLGYNKYGEYFNTMSLLSDQTVLPFLTTKILTLDEDIINNLNRGIKVLDVGCGQGHALLSLAKTFPNSMFYGYDIYQPSIENARKEAEKQQLSNLTFNQIDGNELKEEDQYDLVTAFDSIHDHAKPSMVLKNIYRAMKSGGIFLMQDMAASSVLEKNIGKPTFPITYVVSCLHCIPVSLSQNEGEGLGCAWGMEAAMQLLEKTGFREIKFHFLPHDFQNYYCLAKK